MTTKNKIRIIISAGGTGGHVFPAIAIANALKEKADGIELLFVGAKGKMEMEKVPQAGYKIEGLWISGLQRRLTLKNLCFPLKIISSLVRAAKIINKFKPDAVVGVGGYASWPILRVAASKKIPIVIQEQNSYPGITNKKLAGYADKICVAYEGMEKFFPGTKIVITGNPVRQDIIDIENKKEEAAEFFGLKKDKITILAIGGSLGALSINQSIQNNFDIFRQKGLQLLWQTGKNFINNAQEILQESDNENIKVYEFITRMDLAYSISDIIISRAGAIAISEICIAGKPAVFVPFPNAAEDHQTKNAMELVKNNAAILIKDNELNEKIRDTISNIVSNKDQMTILGANIKKMAIKDSASRIADVIINTLRDK